MPDKLYEALWASRDTVVPVVGAGLVVDAGAPSSSRITTDLVGRARAYGSELEALDRDSLSLFDTADALERSFGPEWVQRAVADIFAETNVGSTRVLEAVVRAPSRIVLTTNYDDGLENAARAVGLTVERLCGPRSAFGLRSPEAGIVKIVHLHGHYSDPSSIVLTTSSYEEAVEDASLALIVRGIASSWSLLFLGHAFGEEESTLRRHLSWCADQLPDSPKHLLLCRRGSEEAERAQDLGDEYGIFPAECHDPTEDFSFVKRAVRILAGASCDVLGAARAETGLFDPHYQPVEVALASDVSDPDARARWKHEQTLLRRERCTIHDLAHIQRLWIVGGPGHGKTQALLQIAKESEHPALYLRVGDMRPPSEGETDEDVFVMWMAKASSFRDGIPQFSESDLRERLLLLS